MVTRVNPGLLDFPRGFRFAGGRRVVPGEPPAGFQGRPGRARRMTGSSLWFENDSGWELRRKRTGMSPRQFRESIQD